MLTDIVIWIKYRILQKITISDKHTEITVLLQYLKICLDADLKIILLDHQNNYIERLSVNDNAAKCFNSLAT